jgi:hypothetical protein
VFPLFSVIVLFVAFKSIKNVPALRRLKWLSATTWALSWFGLCLEIFLWHHVTTSLQLNGPKAPPGFPAPQPGDFVISILIGSALAPLAFVTAVVADRVRSRQHPMSS